MSDIKLLKGKTVDGGQKAICPKCGYIGGIYNCMLNDHLSVAFQCGKCKHVESCL